MRYGVYVAEMWEAWITEYDTLDEALAEVRQWTDKPKPSHRGYTTDVMLVQVISRHKEGDTHGTEAT